MADHPAAVDADSVSAGNQRCLILGVPLDIVSRSTAVAMLRARPESAEPGLMHVVTLNPEYVMAARRNPNFLSAIERAELVLCDGVGTLMAARLGNASPQLERLTGVELIDFLARFSSFQDHGGVFLLGGQNAEAAATALRSRFPAARIQGGWSGGNPSPALDQGTVARIAASGADLLLVGYGAPAQVEWIERNRQALQEAGVKVAAGIGGAIDYLSGDAHPAPAVVRRLGLEWGFRLVREPWRWRRQVVLIPFAAMAAMEAIGKRRAYRILAATSEQNNGQDRST